MQKIYVVVKSGGDYDAYYHTNYTAFTSEEAAEAYIEEQKALEILTYESNVILAEFAREYINVNPHPERPRVKPLPMWQGVKEKDITSKMKAERKAIFDENQRNSQEYNRQQMAHYAKLLAAQKAFAVEKGLVVPETWVYSAFPPDKEDEWSIEELELRS